MSAQTSLNDCGCCEGISAEVPEPLENRPGLDQVRYRVGTHGEFLTSALAALSDPQFAALRALTTRAPDDFTVALLDGWATLADVLTFYQERIANEQWLRTATERDSVLRLARLIGYKPKPGVAASTPLSFTLDETPGAPSRVTIEIGTRVQSVPGAGEKPQTFETVEALDARVEWNALRPLQVTPSVIDTTTTRLWLQGTATNLQAGDAILILGDERAASGTASPNKDQWGLRVLLSVTPDAANDRTLVTWQDALKKPPATGVKIFAMRQRAALFGHNAPDPALVAKPGGAAVGTWPGFDDAVNPIELDNAYPKIVQRSWIVLALDVATVPVVASNAGGLPVISLVPGTNVYQARSVTFPSRAAFGLSGKTTRITPDVTERLEIFGRRDTLVYAQSEPLEMTSGPLLTPDAGSLAASLIRDPDLLAPVEGAVIALDRLIPALTPGRKVIVSGKRLRVRVAADTLTLTSADGLQTRTLSRGDSLILLARPSLFPLRIFPSFLRRNVARWNLRADDGFEGAATTSRGSLILTPARVEDETVSELAVVHSCAGEPSVLMLENPALGQFYDRATVTISANVADATHGETVAETLGSGDASQPNQRFVLKQAPLTYVHSPGSPGGAASTLQIRVDNLLWHEVPTLFAHEKRERIFTTLQADDGTVTVQFGDGERGARLPSGTANVKAVYRRGIGLGGLVKAGQLTTLLTRPPGLKSAINPLPAEGADDPEPLANARENAPLSVLTLDRVVSLEDYEDFSRAYAGIAKALATWTWDGRARGVFITVAGAKGAAVAATLREQLIASIHAAGDPFVPILAASYTAVTFRISGQLRVLPDYDPDVVTAGVIAAWRGAFSCAVRAFGQPVMLSEVIALAQAVPGVLAINVKTFHRTGAAATLQTRLEASLPSGGDPATLAAAELLTLDPEPLDLEVLPP